MLSSTWIDLFILLGLLLPFELKFPKQIYLCLQQFCQSAVFIYF